MTDKFLVISLGQLTNSSIWTSVSTFASLSAQYSYFPKFLSYPYYFINTTLRYAYDLLVGGNIQKYKKGDLDDGQFCRFLQSQLSSSLTHDDLKNGWNSMCSMGEKEKANLNLLMRFLADNSDIKAIMASHTNSLQCDHIMEQMNESEAFSTARDQIQVLTSFTEKESSIHALATTGIRKNLTGNSCKVYSMHYGVKELAIEGCTITQKCEPFNPSKDSFTERLEGAVKFFNSRGA